MKSFLTPLLLTTEGKKSPAIIHIHDDETVSVADFSAETSNTVFIPQPIVLLRSDSLTEFLIDDLQHILATMPSPHRYDTIHNLLHSSDLYFTHQLIKTQSPSNLTQSSSKSHSPSGKAHPTSGKTQSSSKTESPSGHTQNTSSPASSLSSPSTYTPITTAPSKPNEPSRPLLLALSETPYIIT